MSNDSSSNENPYQAPEVRAEAIPKIAPIALPFEVSGTLTKVDFLPANGSSTGGLSRASQLGLVAIVFFGLCYFFTFSLIPGITWYELFEENQFFVLGFAIVAFLIGLRKFQAMMAARSQEEIQFHYRFTEQGVEETYNENHAVHQWISYQSVQAFPEAMWLRQTQYVATVVPKRCFADDDQWDSFVVMIEQQFSPATRAALKQQETLKQQAATSSDPTSSMDSIAASRFAHEDGILAQGQITLVELSVVSKFLFRCLYFTSVAGILMLLCLFANDFLPAGWFDFLYRASGFLFVVLLISALLCVISAYMFFRVYFSQFRKKQILYRFSDSGVHIHTAHSISDVGWKTFIKVRQQRNLVMLQLTNKLNILVPRRFFSSEADFQKALALFRYKIENIKQDSTSEN